MIDHQAIRSELHQVACEAARMGVSICLDLEDDSIHIPDLGRDRNDPSTKGNGLKTLRLAFAVADRHGLPVDIEHMADEPRLGMLYAAIGFERIGEPDGPTINMRRLPQAGETKAALASGEA